MELRAKTALIIIDMQNGFCHEDGFMNKIGLDWTTSRDAIGPVKQLAAAARAADLPVFYTRYTLNPDYSDAGLMHGDLPGDHGGEGDGARHLGRGDRRRTGPAARATE